MAGPTSSVKPLDYYLVVDFEATCDNRTRLTPQEIIEFPVLKVNAHTLKKEAEFHTYVRPTFHPVLTPFCTELTGITQSMVDGQPTFTDAFKQFHEWMDQNGLLGPDLSSCFVTCGDWDLKTMLPSQCALLGIQMPDYFRRWINIKILFMQAFGVRGRGLPMMLQHLGLQLEGRHHSGIDDCRNIHQILVSLATKLGDKVQPTGQYM